MVHYRQALPSRLKLALLMSVALGPVPAFAQDAPPIPPPEPARPEAAAPHRLESGIDVGATWSDNIFATRNDEVDDLIVTLKPSFSYTVGPRDRRFVARARGELGRYGDYGSEDYDDWQVGADGRYALTQAVTLLGGGDYQWRHEARSSPEAVGGLEPTEYEQAYLFGGLLLRRNAVSARLAATVTDYDFSDVPAAVGVLNNDDRDRTQSELGVRLGWQARPGREWFVQGAWDRREYDAPIDDYGFARDSDGLSLALGLRHATPRLTTEVFTGAMSQDYEDSRLGEVTALDVGALVDWVAPGGLELSFRLDRSIGETTLPEAAAYVATTAALNVTASPHPRLQAGAGFNAAHYDYRGAPRSETAAGLRTWGRYWIDPRIFVGLEHSFTQRTSSAAGLDYDENRFMVQLGARLQPRRLAGVDPFVLDPAAPGGAYVGALLGHGVLATGLDGPRGPGSNTADFADMGPGFGLVGGYGWVSGSVYLGLEAEGFVEGPEWRHLADRQFRVHREDALGLSVRLGHVTRGRDLIYARAGVQSAGFRTTYLHATHLSDETERRTGLGGGFGLEAAAGDRGFVRAEYLVTSWEDYDVPTGSGNFDNFSNSESQFRIGGGVRFGAQVERDAPAAAMDFAGSYLGVQIGHGALISDNEGDRSGGTTVDIIRGSHGPLIGAVVGHGWTAGRLYAGVEASGDVSGINWNIERDPNGRVYSADHDYSVGASARLGWRVSDTALIYGRAGAVRTRFEIPYATSGVSVRSKTSRTGLRLGAGLEVALSERARLRLDYSVTDYERYDVVYSTNSDSFDHAASLTTIGFVWKL